MVDGEIDLLQDDIDTFAACKKQRQIVPSLQSVSNSKTSISCNLKHFDISRTVGGSVTFGSFGSNRGATIPSIVSLELPVCDLFFLRMVNFYHDSCISRVGGFGTVINFPDNFRRAQTRDRWYLNGAGNSVEREINVKFFRMSDGYIYIYIFFLMSRLIEMCVVKCTRARV